MPALADLQAAVRAAVVCGDMSAVAPLLVGGRAPQKRLAIHQRHFAASLITALLDRFPATVWLVGSDLVTHAARMFVEKHPPLRPCIAEYGEAFPVFLAGCPGASTLPYLEQFAQLEWHIGRLALAIEQPALIAVPVADPRALAEMFLEVQPSVHYLHLDWSLDGLIGIFISGTEPEQYTLAAGDVWLEVRGVRGEIRMNRLAEADFSFRAALASGSALGDAALIAISRDPAFDADAGLASLLADGLVAAVQPGHASEAHQ